MSAPPNPSDTGSSPFSVDVSALPQATGGINSENEERLSRAQKPKPTQRKDGFRPANIAVDQRSLDPNSSLRNTSAMASEDVRRSSSPYSGSPSRAGALGRSSPRHLSPATSQIFERDVQESTVLAPELSPAIPSHVTTEDHIPPVLEASTLAITDNLNPDEVEVIQSSAHQPASAAVAHSGLGDANPSAHVSHADLSHTTGGLVSTSPSLPGGLSNESFHPQMGGLAQPSFHESQDTNESGSAYGAVDPMDPRRLSFISFADVVHAEHAEQASLSGADSVHMLSSGAPSIAGGNRSPSPARSPVMSSSPQSRLRQGEASPVRGGAGGSMMSGHGAGVVQSGHGEITIETMRQTLQKTGSNDVAGSGGAGSQPMSATSAEDVSHSQPVGR